MLKKIVCIMGAVAIFILAVGCSSEPQKPKLGVSWCYKMGERKTVYGRSC